jgi:hypothetical protein
MRIDLHIHTFPRSSCSQIDPKELLLQARRVGLDGLCLTEHQELWSPGEIEEIAQDRGIRIFRGNEITTNQGDILVFGYEENVKGVIMIQELRKRVVSERGLMIAAHPFRGFLLFGIGQLQMKVEEACQRTLFQYVDGVEIFNSKVTDSENEMARQVAERLGLLAVAGSDAHRIADVGRGVTILEGPVQNERELIEALRTRRFTTEWHR